MVMRQEFRKGTESRTLIRWLRYGEYLVIGFILATSGYMLYFCIDLCKLPADQAKFTLIDDITGYSFLSISILMFITNIFLFVEIRYANRYV